jgi:5'-nucleotidase
LLKSSLNYKRTTIISLFLVSLFLTIFPVQALDDTVAVQILSINDFHGSILQTVQINNRPVGGAAILATWLKEREAANPNTLMVYAGDLVGGSQPISALLQDEPTVEIANFIGFDTGVPGNHEFDEGFAELLRLHRGGSHPATGYFYGAEWPLVLANVVNKKTKEPVLPPYAIKVTAGIPIAFIGIVTLDTPSCVTPSGIQDLEFLDPATAVNRYIPELRKKGVETIIVLAHEGGTQGADGKIEGPIAAIAAGIDDAVDLIVSGHTHTMLNGTIGHKLIVQAGSKGTAFADVDLEISRTTGDVVSEKAELVTTWADEKKPDDRIVKLIAPVEEKVRPLLEQKIAETAAEITRTQNDAGESALGDLIADAHRQTAKTQIAFLNSGGIRRDLPSGTLTWGILYETQPFGNNLLRFKMTGAQLYHLLDQQWQTGKMLQVSGIKYTWDPQKPVGEKVVKLCLKDGTVIQKNKTYTVAANSFLVGGGDGFTVFTEIANPEVVMNELDALIEYLKTLKQPVAVKSDGRVGRQ